MKLDRNLNADGRGKYGLILSRRLAEVPDTELAPIQNALDILKEAGILDWCDTPASEVFVIRLKDKYAGEALRAYARAAYDDDPEYGAEVRQLANYAGANNAHCKRPD